MHVLKSIQLNACPHVDDMAEISRLFFIESVRCQRKKKKATRALACNYVMKYFEYYTFKQNKRGRYRMLKRKNLVQLFSFNKNTFNTTFINHSDLDYVEFDDILISKKIYSF